MTTPGGPWPPVGGRPQQRRPELGQPRRTVISASARSIAPSARRSHCVISRCQPTRQRAHDGRPQVRPQSRGCWDDRTQRRCAELANAAVGRSPVRGAEQKAPFPQERRARQRDKQASLNAMAAWHRANRGCRILRLSDDCLLLLARPGTPSAADHHIRGCLSQIEPIPAS